jgi:hypothetical protein
MDVTIGLEKISSVLRISGKTGKTKPDMKLRIIPNPLLPR